MTGNVPDSVRELDPSIVPMRGPFDSVGWPPAEPADREIPLEPEHDDAPGCASASPAQGSASGEGSSNAASAPDDVALPASAPAVESGEDACGLTKGLHPVAEANDIASAHFPDCGGLVSRGSIARFPTREGSFL